MEELGKKQDLKSLVDQKLKDPDSCSDESIVKLVEELRLDWLKSRQQKGHDRQWLTNIKFYAGDHYVRQNSKGSGGGYKVRLKENHVNNIVQRFVSIVLQSMPIVRVFPVGADWTDRQNAEKTEEFGKYYWRTQKVEKKIKRLIQHAGIFGDGFIHAAWNPDVGDYVHLDAEETDTGKKGEGYWQGETELSNDQPFSILPRPGYEDMDDLPDVIRQKPCSKADLETRYGPIEAESVKFGTTSQSSVREDSNMVMKNEYYHKPTSWWPEGAYICWAGNKLFKVQKFPYKKLKALPIVKLGFDQIPGQFFCQGVLDQIIDLQEQLNKAASMIIEARNLMARPRWLASNEAKVSSQQFTDRAGDVIKYAKAGGAPTPFVPSFNFNELSANKADIRNAMGQVSGITGASRGEIPAATRTALALQLVLEQDRSQFMPFISEMKQVVIDIMQMVFLITAENIDRDDARLVKIEGKSKPTLFHGGMVPTPLDIYLEDTNPLGWTAAGRIESVMELVNGGLIKDQNQALEMIDIKSPDPAYRLQDINRQAAEKENEDLMEGKILDPLAEDMDMAHLDVHLRLASTYEFRTYPPVVQKAITYHIEKHKERERQFGAAMADPQSPQMKEMDGAMAEQMGPPVSENMDALLSK